MNGTPRKKFICPNCGKSITAPVIDTATYYNGYKRYRACEECGVTFVTLEKVSHITRGSDNERKAISETRIAED